MELRDSKGIKYDMDSTNSSLAASAQKQASLGEQMPPGVAVTTTLLFDVAPGTSGMYLYLVQGSGAIALTK